jgi:DNA-binding MarR family transcriptional regulator
MARKAQIAEETWEAFNQVMATFKGSFLEIARRFDLTPGELQALKALDPDHPQPMGALAGELRCDASNITWLADRLEARGLVERRTAPTDRRVKTLALTEDGKAVREKVVAHFRTPPPQLLMLPVHELRELRCLLRKCSDGHIPTPDEVTP